MDCLSSLGTGLVERGDEGSGGQKSPPCETGEHAAGGATASSLHRRHQAEPEKSEDNMSDARCQKRIDARGYSDEEQQLRAEALDTLRETKNYSTCLIAHDKLASEVAMVGEQAAVRAGTKSMTEMRASGVPGSEEMMESIDHAEPEQAESKEITGIRPILRSVPEPTTSSQLEGDKARSGVAKAGADRAAGNTPRMSPMVDPPIDSHHNGSGHSLNMDGNNEQTMGAGGAALVSMVGAREGGGGPLSKPAKPLALQFSNRELADGGALAAREPASVRRQPQPLKECQAPQRQSDACLRTQSLQQRPINSAGEDQDDHSECTHS